MKFSDIIGHKKNIKLLKKMAEASRIPHAIMFTGPEGVGKRMLAFVFAAWISCETPSNNGPCGKCGSCIRLKNGTHPLIKFIGSLKDEKQIEIEYSSDEKIYINNTTSIEDESRSTLTKKININQVRQIIREAALKPYGAEKKIFIIDDVANSSIEALNALLKILEEPPVNTFFVLITSMEEALLPTVISRCNRMEFTTLSDKEMKEFCEKKAEYFDENTGIENIIGMSMGQPGRICNYMNMDNVDLAVKDQQDFFESVRNWYSDSRECLQKLRILLDREGQKFKRNPEENTYDRILAIEESIKSIKANANTELTVSNLFIKLGEYKL